MGYYTVELIIDGTDRYRYEVEARDRASAIILAAMAHGAQVGEPLPRQRVKAEVG